MHNDCNHDSCSNNHNKSRCNSGCSRQYSRPTIKDFGPRPLAININKVTRQNDCFRVALWTGCHLQVTLMSLKVGEDIGLEMHPNVDQFIRIEQGQGVICMGNRRDRLEFEEKVCDDFAIIIPAGTWHNLINTGCVPLKLYSIYAPPQHPHGTVQPTKADAEDHHRRNNCQC